jgi:hypothetical protein
MERGRLDEKENLWGSPSDLILILRARLPELFRLLQQMSPSRV